MSTVTTHAVKQVRQHRAALAWWVRVHHEHPLGIVPIPTAARILGVTGGRIRDLIAEGRLRLVEGMPGGSDRDKFVPVLDLIDGPFVLDRGRPALWGPENRFSQNFLDRSDYRGKRKSRNRLRLDGTPNDRTSPNDRKTAPKRRKS